MKKLNIGCGTDIREGYINLDCVDLKGVDVLHDIKDLPLPFESNMFDEVICRSILEHADPAPLLREIHRILTPGGCVIIVSPHFSAADAYRDPTHVRFYSIESFDFFLSSHKRNYYFGFGFSGIEKFIRFDKRRLYAYNRLLERIVNINKTMQALFEETPLRVFPAQYIDIKLYK